MLKCRLGEILDERGMKQKYLSDKLGVTRNTISSIVRGNKTDIETALKISKLLGLKLEDIWSIAEEQ